jgi:hypothetical protein
MKPDRSKTLCVGGIYEADKASGGGVTRTVYRVVFINGELNMKTVLIVVSLAVLLAVLNVATLKGLDLKRRSSWLYGVISFLSGVGVVIGINGNLIEGLIAGVIFAFMTLFSGASTHRHKQEFEGKFRSLVIEYGKDDDPSLLAKLVRKLFGKYK